MEADLTALEKVLNYHFKQADLLKDALTHRSVRGANNERLEFLGDSILNFIIAEALYYKFPEAKEGPLSRVRANMVRGDTLAELALEFQLGEHMTLGAGEQRSGGQQRTSILADAVEAIIASIYIDSDFDSCRKRVLAWYASRLDEVSLNENQKDPKTNLQEYLQAKKQALPIYTVESIKGDAHKQVFHVSCKVEGMASGSEGFGSSRRRAEQDAAEKLLEEVKSHD